MASTDIPHPIWRRVASVRCSRPTDVPHKRGFGATLVVDRLRSHKTRVDSLQFQRCWRPEIPTNLPRRMVVSIVSQHMKPVA
jgi:hypothetical protein